MEGREQLGYKTYRELNLNPKLINLADLAEAAVAFCTVNGNSPEFSMIPK